MLAEPPAAGVAIAPPRLSGYVQVREIAEEGVGPTARLNRVRVLLEWLRRTSGASAARRDAALAEVQVQF